jgi:tyrosyl-tRNA synthetase
MSEFLSDLHSRGLVHQCTDAVALEKHLSTGQPSDRSAYVGFDPTADSLTVGNLVGIITLARFQRAGHTPVALMGGGTGLIGDPSGKSAERMLLSRDQVVANVERIRKIFEPVLDFSNAISNRALMPDNFEWLGRMSYIDVLRDVGKHFSVNMMIQKDSVRERLHHRDKGISYTEFSYMLLQSIDFLELRRSRAVTLQMGGSDQWGNIVCGIDLVRRSLDGAESFGIVWPLVTKADGTKFGKTESGAVWLSPDRTSPYEFYQFWLNAADADVERFLKTYTFIPVTEISELMTQHSSEPNARHAQRKLANQVTNLIHGPSECERAEAAAAALFTGELSKLPKDVLEQALSAAPSSTHDRADLVDPGMSLLDLLAQTTLASSKSEARTLLAQGSIFVNGHKAAADARVTTGTLLHGHIIALRRGKRTWHVTLWS